MPEAEAAVRRIRPFWGRVTLIPSPVDESERASGLIVPHQHEDDEGVLRGVVVAVDRFRGEPADSIDDVLPGTVVWYRGGVRVHDVVVVERKEILAYEEAE